VGLPHACGFRYIIQLWINTVFAACILAIAALSAPFVAMNRGTTGMQELGKAGIWLLPLGLFAAVLIGVSGLMALGSAPGKNALAIAGAGEGRSPDPDAFTLPVKRRTRGHQGGQPSAELLADLFSDAIHTCRRACIAHSEPGKPASSCGFSIAQ
jgi:hypothetical protein